MLFTNMVTVVVHLCCFFSSVKAARHQVASSDDICVAVFVTKTVCGKIIIFKCLPHTFSVQFCSLD